MIEAVIFDLDGVLIDSEEVWDGARRAFVGEHGGHYTNRATRDMMGMSAPEWARYIRTQLGVEVPEPAINAEVAARVAAAYRQRLPLLPGAVDVVRSLGRRFELGLASSSNRSLIELFLELTGLHAAFKAVVSSEEVGRGKPAPDVYLRAAELLAIAARACSAVEDSSNGIRAAHAAGMRTIAIPNRSFPPAADALALADAVILSLADLTIDVVTGR